MQMAPSVLLRTFAASLEPRRSPRGFCVWQTVRRVPVAAGGLRGVVGLTVEGLLLQAPSAENQRAKNAGGGGTAPREPAAAAAKETTPSPRFASLGFLRGKRGTDPTVRGSVLWERLVRAAVRRVKILNEEEDVDKSLFYPDGEDAGAP